MKLIDSGLILEEDVRFLHADLSTLDFTSGRRLLLNTGLVASNGLRHRAALKVVRGEC